MLAVKYLASGCVFFGWVINEQNGTFFYQIDDSFRLIRGNCRATITSAAELIHFEKIRSDILTSMHHNIPASGLVVNAAFHPAYSQGKSVVAKVSSLCDKKPETAFVR